MPDANPITISVSFDRERGARAVIGPDGGTIQTTDAAGVTYTLTVPAEALQNTHGVRLTPVSFEGLPFSSPATAGVVVEPAGVQLQAYATLDIAGSAPGGQAFTFHGPGNDLARWIAVSAETSSLPVLGFAGFGLAPQTTGPADWRPGDPVSRAVHDLAPSFYGDGPVAMVGIGPIAQGVIDDQKVIETLCAAAKSRFDRATAMIPQGIADPLGIGQLIIGEILTVTRTTGASCAEELEPDFHALAQIFSAAARELSRRCETRSHDPRATLHRAIGLIRQAVLLGMPDEDYEALLTDAAGVRPCTGYRLFIDSTINLTVTFHHYVDGGDVFDVEGTVVSGRKQLPLRAVNEKGLLRWREFLPLQIRSEQWQHECWTGQPFRLVRDLAERPAVLHAQGEPIIDYKRTVDPAGMVRVADESTRLRVFLNIEGYALMPAKQSTDCGSLNPLLWDVGGSFMGAWGIDPFEIEFAGDTVEQADEGEAFITPPGTDTLVLAGHHAALEAVHHFTSDTAGPTFDLREIFPGP